MGEWKYMRVRKHKMIGHTQEVKGDPATNHIKVDASGCVREKGCSPSGRGPLHKMGPSETKEREHIQTHTGVRVLACSSVVRLSSLLASAFTATRSNLPDRKIMSDLVSGKEWA